MKNVAFRTSLQTTGAPGVRTRRTSERTREGELMGLRHRHHPTFGVQFHPESILTTHGKKLLGNFLSMV